MAAHASTPLDATPPVAPAPAPLAIAPTPVAVVPNTLQQVAAAPVDPLVTVTAAAANHVVALAAPAPLVIAPPIPQPAALPLAMPAMAPPAGPAFFEESDDEGVRLFSSKPSWILNMFTISSLMMINLAITYLYRPPMQAVSSRLLSSIHAL